MKLNNSTTSVFAPIFDRPVLVLILIGMLIRLAIMPFFSHVDLYSEFRRVVYSINNEIYFPQQNRLVTFYIEYGFLSVMMPFLKETNVLFFLESLSRSTSNLTDYFLFINDPSVFRHLFIFKLPYLLFDVLTMWVIYLFFDDKRRAKIAVLLWVFNPITLYATYFFGRYEAIPLLFVALTALMLKKEKPFWAVISLCLAINSREIYVVLAPIFILSVYNENLKLSKNAFVIVGCSVLLLASILFPVVLEHYFHFSPAFSQGSVYNDDKANALYGMAYHWFYPLIFAYIMTLFVYATQSFMQLEYKFIAGSGIVLASYFLLAGHSAHYVAWLPLFPILLLNYPQKARDLGFAIVFFFIAWFVYRLFKGDINLFTLFLAAPFNFELTLLPSVPRVYTRWIGESSSIFGTEKILDILRTIFAASLIFLIYHMHNARKVVKRFKREEK